MNEDLASIKLCLAYDPRYDPISDSGFQRITRDSFYQIILLLDGRSVLELSRANRTLSALLFRASERHIWTDLWRRDLSEIVPPGTVTLIRNRYLRAINILKGDPVHALWYASVNGFEKAIQSALRLDARNLGALVAAAREGHLLTVRSLMNDSRYDSKSQRGDAIRSAIANDRFDVLEILIEGIDAVGLRQEDVVRIIEYGNENLSRWAVKCAEGLNQ